MFDISSLENNDFICLVATFNDLTDVSINNATAEVQERGFTPQQLAAVKMAKANKFEPFVSCGLRFIKPFDHLKFDQMNYVSTLFENYERGHLPFPGSVSEQPAQIMEIFSVMKVLTLERDIKLKQASSNGRH